jgi:hypothetical protein
LHKISIDKTLVTEQERLRPGQRSKFNLGRLDLLLFFAVKITIDVKQEIKYIQHKVRTVHNG